LSKDDFHAGLVFDDLRQVITLSKIEMPGQYTALSAGRD